MTDLPPPKLVADQPALDDLRARLSDAERVAVDTESNSMHAHTERVCLVQISVGEDDYLVDPLAVDITPLGDLFEDARTEKILHAAEYDVMCLRRDYDFSFENLFDTMLAARILGWKRLGLGSILDDLHGIKLDKKMQRHDWARRPLTPAAVDYARLDTRFLEGLREHLHDELEEAERVAEARAAFARVAKVEASERTWDPDGYWRIKGARKLDPPAAAVLRELWSFREQLARRIDRPLFKIMGDATMVELARTQPKDRGALGRIKGVSEHLVRRNARAILDAVRHGLAAEPPSPPPKSPRGPKTEAERRFEDLRRWRRERAEERGVEPDVILGKRELTAVAEAAPGSADALRELGALDEWQLATYAENLLRVLAGDDAT